MYTDVDGESCVDSCGTVKINLNTNSCELDCAVGYSISSNGKICVDSCNQGEASIFSGKRKCFDCTKKG